MTGQNMLLLTVSLHSSICALLRHAMFYIFTHSVLWSLQRNLVFVSSSQKKPTSLRGYWNRADLTEENYSVGL